MDVVVVSVEYESLEIPPDDTDFSDSDVAFYQLICGNIAIADKLSTSNKVTLYISGSLEDTHVERKYINRYVIPKMELWCNAHGYDFFGVDLRWGTTSEITDDHKTYVIHMDELRKAYSNSFITLFYFISGQRYGSALLPPVISQADREAIREELKESIRWVLDASYYLDENGDPPVYRLQNISQIENSAKHSFWDNESVNHLISRWQRGSFRPGWRGIHSLMKEIMTVCQKCQSVSEELKAWQPSLAMAECDYALNATTRSRLRKDCVFVVYGFLSQATETNFSVLEEH